MNKSAKYIIFAVWLLIRLCMAALLAIFTIIYLLLFGREFEVNVYFSSFALIAAAWILLLATFVPFKRIRKGVLIGGGAVALAGVIAISACLGYNAWLDSIRVIDKSAIDTDLYLAFDPNSKIARLGHDASLSFSVSDDLPVLDGAAAFFPIYSAFVEAVYPKNIPALNRKDSPYQYHNTITGYERLANGETDIFFAFGPDEEQTAYASSLGVSFELIPIGKEAFVFFTNSKNSVTDLSVDEIKAIYSGAITNWSEVGGENAKILPYQRNKGSGSQTALAQFMGDTPLMDAPTELRNDFMWGIIEVVADYQNHRGALGFSFRNYADEIVANQNIRLLWVNGAEPTLENIESGAYPVTMPFYMVLRREAHTKEELALIDWVLSEEGQSLVAASGFARI